MVATPNARQFAERIDRDMSPVMRAGILQARRAAIQVRKAVLTSWRTGQPLDVARVLGSELLPAVADAGALLHLRGMEAAQRLATNAPPAALSFADGANPLDKLLRRIRDRRRLNALRDQYQVRAFDLVSGLSVKVQSRVQLRIAELIAEGTPINRGVAELSKTFDDLGLTPRSGWAIETTFRTQSQVAYNAGRWQADQDPDIQSVLWGYQYATVGDDRVRPTHEALEGVRLPKDDPAWRTFWPPNGFNCRCVAIPLFDPVRVVRPKPALDDGTPVQPDAGFAQNFGLILAA